jgi:hypothetical protein
MLTLNYQPTPGIEDAIRAKLSPGEQLITWCEVFQVEFEAAHGAMAEAWDLQLLSNMPWSFLALTNINLRQGTFRAEKVGKAGFFKAQEYRMVPNVASITAYAISQITTTHLLLADPEPQVNKALSGTIDGWRSNHEIGVLTISLVNGAVMEVNSPFREIEELATQLDLAKSGALLAANTAATADAAEQLAALLNDGILTQDEFDRAKAGFIGATLEVRETSAGQIRQLHSLFKSGVLTESEFNMKKWDILSKDG